MIIILVYTNFIFSQLRQSQWPSFHWMIHLSRSHGVMGLASSSTIKLTAKTCYSLGWNTDWMAVVKYVIVRCRLYSSTDAIICCRNWCVAMILYIVTRECNFCFCEYIENAIFCFHCLFTQAMQTSHAHMKISDKQLCIIMVHAHTLFTLGMLFSRSLHLLFGMHFYRL